MKPQEMEETARAGVRYVQKGGDIPSWMKSKGLDKDTQYVLLKKMDEMTQRMLKEEENIYSFFKELRKRLKAST